MALSPLQSGELRATEDRGEGTGGQEGKVGLAANVPDALILMLSTQRPIANTIYFRILNVYQNSH